MEKPKTTPAPAASSQLSTDVSSKQKAKARKTLIEKCQAWIFAAYRIDQFSDVEGYIDSLNHVLAQYPDDVILHISDPRTGVQRSCKWPPTIAEIVTACEVHMQHLAKLDRLKNWGKKEEPRRLEAPREERPTIEEMKAKYGEDWGLTPDPRPKPGFKTGQAPSWQEIASMYHRDPSRVERLMKAMDKYADHHPHHPTKGN